MKKLNQHLLLAAAMMLAAGAAHAQTPAPANTTNPTNQFSRTPRQAGTPFGFQRQTSQVIGAGPNTPAPSYSSYSQDSYVQQTNNFNYAQVDQQDTRGNGERASNSGSTAVLNQTGASNSAFQSQTANASSNVADGRNFMRATQAGLNSQSSQTQTGGFNNVAVVEQGASTSSNGAYQSQTGNGSNNSARITQSFTASGNRATQSQSQNNQTAVIEQQGTNSYALQSQSGGFGGNDAYIGQGAPGDNNTAIQDQSGASFGRARIRQSVGLPQANNNYARQNQSGFADQADIEQRSSNNYARQDQMGSPTGFANNKSLITQGVADGGATTVNSAAYTSQSGYLNQAIITQK